MHAVYLSPSACESAFVVFFFICLSCSLLCERSVEPRDPSHPVAVSLVPCERETDRCSEGQPGISYPGVRPDLAWMGLCNWLMGYCFVFFHLFLCLFNFCIVLISARFSMPGVAQFDGVLVEIYFTLAAFVPVCSLRGFFLSFSGALASHWTLNTLTRGQIWTYTGSI